MEHTKPIPVIIPAAGVGSRMQAKVAKQYLRMGSKSILEHTLEVFLQHPLVGDIIVVLHKDDEHFSTLPCAGNKRVTQVIGGNERADSVMCGLRFLQAQQYADWVMVHDAARPCVSIAAITNLVQQSINTEGGILAIPVSDTLKQAISDKPVIEKTICRRNLWQAQTPQLFKAKSLIDAINYARDNHIEITDEASAMEFSGHPVKLIEGESNNIKITRPSDLALAEFFLSQKVK